MPPEKRYLLDVRAAGAHFPGIGRYVRGLAAALPALLGPGERLTLLTSPGGRGSFIEPDFTAIQAQASPFGLSQQFRVPTLLKGAGVYHSPYYLMPYRPGVRTVLTVYDLVPMRYPAAVSLQARLLFGLATRLALRTADRVIAISEATRADYLARFPRLDPDRITAVPLAADARFRPQPREEIDRVRSRYGLPPEYGLYVGINKPHKNLPRLVEAWAGLDADLPLVIAGVWDERYPEVRQKAGSLPEGRVRLIGEVPEFDLPALYTGSRLFVFPSLYEGFGLPVVEALACGAAVACSGTSSLPEVGGAAAVYFDPGDPLAIRQGIAEALAARPDPAGSVLQAGRFSWERTASATLEIYRSVAYNGP